MLYVLKDEVISSSGVNLHSENWERLQGPMKKNGYVLHDTQSFLINLHLIQKHSSDDGELKVNVPDLLESESSELCDLVCLLLLQKSLCTNIRIAPRYCHDNYIRKFDVSYLIQSFIFCIYRAKVFFSSDGTPIMRGPVSFFTYRA